MEADFPAIHPQLRQLLKDFDSFSEKEGLPNPVVTDLVRDTEGQVRIYVRFFRKLQAAQVAGPNWGMVDPEDDGTFRALTATEWVTAKEVAGLNETALRQRAARKFTWHWCRCAADLRSRHYSQAQLHRVRRWFVDRCPQPLWEFLVHDVTAPHIHVARRDFVWRTRHTGGQAVAQSTVGGKSDETLKG